MYVRRDVLKIAAGATATSMFSMPSARAKAPLQRTQAPGFYRLPLGSLEVTALSDGTLELPLSKLYTHTTEEHARTVLAASFQAEPATVSVNAFLINTGERLVLIDAGTGSYLGPSLGKLLSSLGAAGYQADQVDEIILTHVHTDHSGGLSRDGKCIFPKAVLHINRLEYEFWLETKEQDRPANVPSVQFKQARETVDPYINKGRLKVFEPNGQVFAGFGSILRPGHTPGHSSIVVGDSGKKIVFWGDITHGEIMQFDEPGVAIEFDVEQQGAIEARAAAFEDAARERYLVAGAHISFPGIGHIRRDDTNYDWVPLQYSDQASTK
ncbi:MBL fold metallo-hydrolase [Sinorhizobium sp. GL28]|uniref:MBL fold metallo-hydrolase n=1 Tax=Sinorhizobium sp. GL28 TaxID=1358418 RepID=UPI00071DA14C|nr:MBL fold metallo-hydrolase [Sinorhizobium sp. GL28]